MILTQICQSACIRVPLEAQDKTGAMHELLDVLDRNNLLPDKNAVVDAVFKREQTRSTGIGFGIAVPHGKCQGITQSVMSWGLAREPIDFDSIDGKPVHIIFMLVSPTDQTGPHIQALARISRLALDEAFMTQWIQSACADEAYALLQDKERELDGLTV